MLSNLYVLPHRIQSLLSIHLVDHAPKNDESSDTSTVLLDELINTIQTKNSSLKEHLEQENQTIEDLTSKKFVDQCRSFDDLGFLLDEKLISGDN